MRPLCRIRSISAVDLQTIAIPYALVLPVMILKNLENLLRALVDRPISIHRDEPASTLVIIGHRTSLLLVGRQTGLNHFQPVVIAGHQLRPVAVTYFIGAGRLEVDVIDPPTGGTRTASSNSEQKLIIVHVKADHNRPSPGRVQVVKERVLQQSVQPPGLSRGPGKTIQDIAALAIRQQ